MLKCKTILLFGLLLNQRFKFTVYECYINYAKMLWRFTIKKTYLYMQNRLAFFDRTFLYEIRFDLVWSFVVSHILILPQLISSFLFYLLIFSFHSFRSCFDKIKRFSPLKFHWSCSSFFVENTLLKF